MSIKLPCFKAKGLGDRSKDTRLLRNFFSFDRDVAAIKSLALFATSLIVYCLETLLSIQQTGTVPWVHG